MSRSWPTRRRRTSHSDRLQWRRCARRAGSRGSRSRRGRTRRTSPSPGAPGLPELRAAIAGWVDRRFAVAVDPDSEIVPTLGSKEAIFSFAQVGLGEKRLVAIPEPAYPVYERGALFAGGAVAGVPLRGEDGWLPHLPRLAARGGVRVFLGCYPDKPTGA